MEYRVNDRDRTADGEAGYVLLAVIFLTVLMLVTLAVAAPKIARSIQRDKDLETIHRGEQYKRAIQLYYRQFNAYPTSFDQLVNTNNVRYLRKKYADPETGKDDWKPVYYGHAHVHPLGFFGQPLSAVTGLMASATAVPGMAGGMYAMGPATTTDANGLPVADTGDGSATGGTDTPGATGTGAGAASGVAGATNSGSGTFSMGGQNGTSSAFGGNAGLGAGQSGFGQSGIGQAGAGQSGFGQSGASSAFGSSTPGSSTPGSSTGTSATSFGGSNGPIVGVTLSINKPSLMDYKLQSKYNKWEFNYDPMEEQMQAAGSLFGGDGGSTGANGTGTGTGGVFGGSTPGTGFGGAGTSGTGTSGTGTTNPGTGTSNPGSLNPGSSDPGTQNPPSTPQ
ncbi:MAG TPA: hypothetical protein VHX60_08055 [Acidobacteriaceae bacterium]|jgi:type II secretory pathway pseudopilin PulG|nr:hypothetical protein [Acidobacteriaceae bacterium]